MPKLKDLKNEAFKLALKLGLTCTTTKQLKKRGLTKGLDMRRKDAKLATGILPVADFAPGLVC